MDRGFESLVRALADDRALVAARDIASNSYVRLGVVVVTGGASLARTGLAGSISHDWLPARVNVGGRRHVCNTEAGARSGFEPHAQDPVAMNLRDFPEVGFWHAGCLRLDVSVGVLRAAGSPGDRCEGFELLRRRRWR